MVGRWNNGRYVNFDFFDEWCRSVTGTLRLAGNRRLTEPPVSRQKPKHTVSYNVGYTDGYVGYTATPPRKNGPAEYAENSERISWYPKTSIVRTAVL